MSGDSFNLKEEVARIKQIETGVIHISAVMKEFHKGRLKEETIITLLHDKTKLSKKAIKAVLDGLSSLEETYLKKEETSGKR